MQLDRTTTFQRVELAIVNMRGVGTDFETILVDVDDGVATVTLNRPEKKNAISLQMEQDLHDALWGLDADDTVRAIVVTGAGDAFCSGFDLSGGAGVFGKEGHEEHDRELGVDSDSVSQRVAYWRMATPIISAINGAAVGVGITLPLLMDIRFAAEDAKLSFVFTRRGILPDASSHWLLPRVIGVANALDLLMTGRTITGREAAELGLVSKALPKDEVLPAALAFAATWRRTVHRHRSRWSSGWFTGSSARPTRRRPWHSRPSSCGGPANRPTPSRA